MPQRLTKQDSTALYFVKAMAIFASVAAHVSLIDQTTPLTGYVTRFWDMFSCISVGNFLIAAGILYTRTPGDSGVYWKRKFHNMVVPWLFCGTLTYVYRLLCGIPGSILEYGYWLLGNGSWLYYVTLHLFMLALFKPFWRCIAALWGCVILNVLQLIYPFVPSPFGNDYLNPANWVGFFALGILLRQQGLRFSRRFLAVAIAVFLVSAGVVYHRWIYSYFHILNALYSVSAFFLLFALGRRLAGTRLERSIQQIGSDTYCIYLLHLFVLLPIFRHLPLPGLKTFLSPVLGLCIMLLLIRLGKAITSKLPFGNKLRWLVGLR